LINQLHTMPYNNNRNRRDNYRRLDNDRDYNYDRDYNNIHHDDPESNTTADYYYEDEFDNYYDDYDVNHPEEMHHEDDYDAYGNLVMHIDSRYDHSNRRRSTEYYDEDVPHTSAMGARYSPRNTKSYNRLENPRSGKEALSDEMYAEGAGYADWDTIDIYGIAGDHRHNVLQNRKRYNGPYNYDYENTESRSRYNFEDQLHRNDYLPVKRSNTWPAAVNRNTRGQNTNTRQNNNLSRSETNNSNQSRSRTSNRNTVSNSRLQQQNEKRNRRTNIVHHDHDEDFLRYHDMYTVKRRPIDRSGAYENANHSGFSRYGNLSDGRYSLQDYGDVFEEDTTGRRTSRQSYGKAGRRNMRERS
jgi:hypothetical protein